MATFTNVNIRPTGDIEQDFLQYKIELERRLRHLLNHIDLSSVILGLTANRLVKVNTDGDLDTVSNLANWIIETTNQITVTNNGDGTVTLSLPQDINTSADVEFDSLVLGDLTTNRMVYADIDKKLQSITDLTNWIAGTTGNITVTNDGDGTITLESIGSKVNVKIVTGNTTLQTTEQGAIECNSAGDFILTLPTAVGNTGISYYITNVNYGIATIEPSGTEILKTQEDRFLPSDYDGINTSATNLYVISNDLDLHYKEKVSIVSDGTDWIVTSERIPDWIFGTDNQVIVTDNLDSTLTLSLPQDIDTEAEPQFAGIKLKDNTNIGELKWNNNDGTLEVALNDDVTVSIGQELYCPPVKNNTGSTISNGSVVYLSGALGSQPTIALADADAQATACKVIGLATQDIANNSTGFVTIKGYVRGLDTSAFSDGDPVYVSTTAGELTNTRPAYGKIRVQVGICVYAHANQGIVLVDVNKEKYFFGDFDNGNYSAFEDDGTMVAYGDAKCTLDEFGTLLGQKLESPSSNITYNYTEGSVDFDTSTTLSDFVIMNVQLNHDYDLTTDLDVHLHWWQTENNTPNWLLEYRWQVNGQAKVTSWTQLAWDSNAFTYSSGTLQQITDFPAISPPSPIGVSSILQIKLYRDNSNASTLFTGTDPYTTDVSALFLDVHKVVDTLGSREEYTK